MTRIAIATDLCMSTLSAITLLGITLVVGLAAPQEYEYPFPSCPEPLVQLPTDPVPLKTILGPWHTIRSVHPPGAPEVDCQTDTYWTNFSGQEQGQSNGNGNGNGNTNATEPVVHLLYQQRMNGILQYHQAAGVNMRHFHGGLVQRNWTFNMFGLRVPAMFVESDDGHSWSIWHTCAETPGSPSPSEGRAGSGYPIWVVMTRERMIGSKLEQELVEKVESYSGSGYTSKELRGVGQDNCY